MMYPPFAVFSPALAAGAAVAAVGVPLVVHLLFRKRYQIVPWAAIRFLLVAERRHKRRIDQWLLLAIRTAALALFLLAMIATTAWAERLWQAVRPGVAETTAEVPRTHHVIVLDASLSTTARADKGGDQTRFQKAVALAEKLVQGGNRGDGFTVFVVTGTARPHVPGPSNDRDKVIAELHKVRAEHGPADHAAALTEVENVLKRSPRAYPRRQVTFFTDLQRASWTGAAPRPDNPAAEVWQRVAARSDVAVVDVAREDRDNLAVADVALADPMPLVDQPTTVTVTVANLGRVERRGVRVELLVGRPSGGDALVSVDQKPVEIIPVGGRTAVKFDLAGPHAFRDAGVHVVQAKLVEGDDLAADDSRALAVEVRDGIHVRLIEGKGDPDPERRAATFIGRALFPPRAKPTDTPIRPKTLTTGEFLDPNVGELTGVDCVFVCDVFNPTPDLAAKLDAVLRRGGTVVFGLGPNAAASRAQYNAVLYRDGNGVLPGQLGDTVSRPDPDAPGFRLYADDGEYTKPPLIPFANDRARAGLTGVPFHSYLKLDVPEGRARRILSFARPQAAPDPRGGPAARPDAALVEWPRHRGRVYVFTSSLNYDWNDWPTPPNYLMFWHEFLKYSVANPDRHTLRVGEPIEEFFPANAAGLTATLTTPDGRSANLRLALQDEAGVASFKDTAVSGLYRIAGVNGSRDRVFAVNPPDVAPGAPSESDLKQISASEFKPLAALQIVSDPDEVRPTDESGATVTTQPRPWGPLVARVAVTAAMVALALELLIAWRFGPSRAGGAGRPAGGRLVLRLAGTLAALLPLAAAGFLLFALAHADRTDNPLGFLPHGARASIEGAAGVPTAAPGEGTRWRLEGYTGYFRNPTTDRRAVAALAVLAVAVVAGIYWLERRAAGGGTRVVVPTLLRASVFLLALYVVLAQLRLAFDREGYPEVVILLDTSASMAHADQFKDAAVRAKAEELAGNTGLSESNRLKLAQALLTRKDADWLDRLLKEKQVKVHLYAVDTQKRVLTAIDDESQLADGRAAVAALKPEGEGSHLGDGVEAVLKDFRGSPLAAIVMFTDGVNTAGPELPKAAGTASREGVPLFLVGVGDTWETPDLALTDFRADEVVGRGDRIAFEVRLTARGEVPGGPVTVFLKEKAADGKLEDRGQATVTPDPSGNPVAVTVHHAPEQVGEKTFILEVPGVPGEANTRNNRLERTVLVTESRKIRVLYVEGYPRYDFRFVKVMLERESDKSVGGKSVELQIVLLDATKGWAETDRSAFRGEFPTRTELFGFDVVILGDVDPKLIGGTRSASVLRDLADFVKEKGGGMLFLSGEHGTPAAFADTPLADVLPVIPGDSPAAKRPPEEQPITDEYQPKLTPAGKIHPLFRFSTDEAESGRIWGNLRPLLWYAKGYRRKPLTSVLATHPTRTAEGGAPGELHPLVVQQFAGAGPVLFLGFDDTWRWRFRSDEEHFDRFWMQAVRVLSRSRVRRPELRIEPKTEFRRDEKVTVQVRFPVEAPPPGDARVRVQMTRTPLPNRDGTPGAGPAETTTLVLERAPNQTGQFETTLPRAPDGEYRFELTDPDLPGTRPGASARVLPPLNERERTELNRADLQAAAAVSGGGFYTLATADDVFADLKNLQRVPLNQPCPPVPLWNSPAVYLLLLLLLTGEWLLRKRERLL